ncbi:MAG: NAD kinase [Cyclobacteriaceae bacterium]|nr:NAD kinase [Cyclobacteriaceae bacterium]
MGKLVVVHGKAFQEEDKFQIEGFFNTLILHGFTAIISVEFFEICKAINISGIDNLKKYNESSETKSAMFAFSFGGDGTLLELLTHVGEYEIPIIGVNMGRLGFLATTSLEKIENAVLALSNADFEVDERVLLQMVSDRSMFENKNYALNDFTILKRDTSSMIKVKVLLDGVYLNTYWADGVIVSTPTGSTGYSLSCGGPLVLPQSNNFVITPVSPHNLNARPLVISDDREITFEIEARSDNVLVSLDSRSAVVPNDVQIIIKKFKKTGKLVKFRDYNQFETMRNKLNWGIDYRN